MINSVKKPTTCTLHSVQAALMLERRQKKTCLYFIFLGVKLFFDLLSVKLFVPTSYR